MDTISRDGFKNSSTYDVEGTYVLHTSFLVNYKEHESYTQEQLKWLEDDYIFGGMILDVMNNNLFDVY